MKKYGSAKWQGDLKTGKGQVSTESGVLQDAAYGFNTRFEDGPGTNPEELIGAAHASCFSMALSNVLGQSDLVPDQIQTKAEVTLDKDGDSFKISAVHLTVEAAVPNASEEDFNKAANTAKENCPISKLFNADITMDVKFTGA